MFDMPLSSIFDIVQPGVFFGVHSAQVTDVRDPDGIGQVQVRLLSCDGFDSQGSLIWARVSVPFSGSKYGAYFIPNVGDEVLVAFLHGDPRFPVVIGSLWHGSAKPPESLSGNSVDRWSITGKEGSLIRMIETSQSEATITISVPGDVSGEFTASGGGKIELQTPSGSITIDSSGITVTTGSPVNINGSQVNITANEVNVMSDMATFSGTIQCQDVQTTSTVSGTYSPGAGNVW
jgi:uncharacterized protein involved in type VI secretion and phage assembly